MKLSSPFKYNKVAINLPASKSISNRVLIINTLACNNILPHNLSDCDDTKVMLKWLKSIPKIIDVGAAGTAMRFSTALLSVMKGTHVITGSARMKQRPISVLVDALRQLGAEIKYLEKDGFPPLMITGTDSLKGGMLHLRGDVSSQFISALLMISPYMKEGLEIYLEGDVVSRPYIDMTLSIMSDFGAIAGWKTKNVLSVKPQLYIQKDFFVENDWSAASYWYEILAMADSLDTIRLNGLYEKSLQGDSVVADIFESFGIKTSFLTENGIPIAILTKEPTTLNYFEYDFMNHPDIAQTMAVTCCMMGIPFHFCGLSSLKIKETDRLFALKTELAKMGFVVEERKDSELLWNGNQRQLTEKEMQNICIETYDDHRMAMAFAPCALKYDNLEIVNPQVVTKSYPNFWNDLQSIGFVCSTHDDV